MTVDGRMIDKAGMLVSDTAVVVLRETGIPFVSRGGLKLDAALRHFSIDVENKVVMDVGSSSGGFTDCLLQRGARKVYCIDVGYGQLAWTLRQDPRVVLLERTNIRNLPLMVKEQDRRLTGAVFDDLKAANVDMATIDVSFISLVKVIPCVIQFLKYEGEIIALVKPQFEVGRGQVGKGGIVRDEEKRVSAVRAVREKLELGGLETIGVFESPIRGQKGNVEYFLYLKRTGHDRG